MVQSRLNKRIRKVRNNISGRQKLLSKLIRIKKQKKKTPKKSVIKRKIRPRSVARRPRKSRITPRKVIRKPRRPRKSKITPRKVVRKPRKIVRKQRKSRTPSVLSIPTNNVIISDSMSNRMSENSNSNRDRNSNSNSNSRMSVNSNSRMSAYSNSNRMSANSRMNANSNACVLKNVHDEMVEVPTEYPGDLWVHNNLEHQRDKPLEFFDEDHLKDVYGHHRKICFGN